MNRRKSLVAFSLLSILIVSTACGTGSIGQAGRLAPGAQATYEGSARNRPAAAAAGSALVVFGGQEVNERQLLGRPVGGGEALSAAGEWSPIRGDAADESLYLVGGVGGGDSAYFLGTSCDEDPTESIDESGDFSTACDKSPLRMAIVSIEGASSASSVVDGPRVPLGVEAASVSGTGWSNVGPIFRVAHGEGPTYFRYDVQNATWRELPPAPKPLASTCVDHGEVFALSKPNNEIESVGLPQGPISAWRLSTDARTWEPWKDLAIDKSIRGSVIACDVGGTVVYGVHGPDVGAAVYTLDSVTGGWRSLGDVPTGVTPVNSIPVHTGDDVYLWTDSDVASMLYFSAADSRWAAVSKPDSLLGSEYGFASVVPYGADQFAVVSPILQPDSFAVQVFGNAKSGGNAEG